MKLPLKWDDSASFSDLAAVNAHDALVAACEAAIQYDKAIRQCADDPDKMASFCTATGDDLDTLYMDWMAKARAALELARKEADRG